jgi:ribonuclease P protein component
LKGISSICSRKIFSSVFRKGLRIRSGGLTLIILKNQQPDRTFENMYAFNFKRQSGNACRRNRLKRLFKEYLRLNRQRIRQGYFLIFCVYKPWFPDTYGSLAQQADLILEKAGLIAGNKEDIIFPGCVF